MNSRERFQRMLRKESVDRPAWAFWRHYPHDDFTQQFVDVHVQDLLRCDYDLWKISLPSAYPVLDYGIRYAFENDPYGRPVFRNQRIAKLQDWKQLEPLEIPNSPILKQMLEVTRRIVAAAPADKPLQATLFSPFTQAARLCGGIDRIMEHLAQDPHLVLSAVEVLAETTRRFATELIKQGVDGFFYAIQECDIAELKPHVNFLDDLNRSILSTGNPWLNTLHLHGKWQMDGLYADYPVAIFHWDTHASGISLQEGSRYFPRIVSGGVNWPLNGWSSAAVRKQTIHQLLTTVENRPFMLSAGCVLPYQTPVDEIKLVANSVEKFVRTYA